MILKMCKPFVNGLKLDRHNPLPTDFFLLIIEVGAKNTYKPLARRYCVAPRKPVGFFCRGWVKYNTRKGNTPAVRLYAVLNPRHNGAVSYSHAFKKKVQLMTNLPTLKIDDLEIIHDEPRIADLKLAKALGYKKSYKVRELIVRNMGSLSSFGTLIPHVGNYKGKQVTTYHLNEKQSLYIIAKSNTPTAAEMTVAMVEVFHAWRHGKLQEPITPPTFYAKTMLADGTDSEVATRNQVKHLIGQVSKITTVLEQVAARVIGVDEKIRVFAVDSDSLARCDMVMSQTLDVVLRHKSYKDRFIKDLKEENLRLRKAMEIMVQNKAMEAVA